MNDNKNYLNEENYQKAAKKFKISGYILMAIGGISFITCSVLLFGNFISFETRALVGFLWVFSFAIIGFGLMATFMGHGRELMAYQTQQAMPIAKEGAKEMAPTAGAVAKEIAKGVKEGINEADEEKKEQ